MRDSPIYVVGAGGHAKVVIATVQAAGGVVAGVFDDAPALHGKTVAGLVIAPLPPAPPPGLALLAVGDNRARQALAARLPWRFATAVHPNATLHPSARLGPGAVVFAGAVVQPDVTVGAHAIVNTGATVDHDCELGDFVHVGPGANLAGNVRVGQGALLGVASAAIPGVSIGAWATCGAGAVCVRDVPPGVTARGVPARWAAI